MPVVDGSVLIAELMESSGVKFGTSGARGLAEAMTDAVCYAYTRAFLQYLAQSASLGAGARVGVASDLRRSSERIATACAKAIRDSGYLPIYCGNIPTPALANYGIRQGIPTLMVTGSHIPEDRNGIKFHTPWGEILKEDEEGIRGQRVSMPPGELDAHSGALLRPAGVLPPAVADARAAYVRRYLEFLPSACLADLRIGLYEQSTVAREVMGEVLEALGARVDRLGRSDSFIPVDTEAIREEDARAAKAWAQGGGFHSIVSADGDGDRPLVSDEEGNWLRGDIAGILCARFLDADVVVTPVSSNTAVEKCGWFDTVIRTRIGSPYVISGMSQALASGARRVVGYEANGGFLVASDLEQGGRVLPALPTRDALIVPLAILLLARKAGTEVSRLIAQLPSRFTASNRLQDFPPEICSERIAELASGDSARDRAAVEALFGRYFGPVDHLDSTDGLRMTFTNGEIAHLRPSGNAPELRAYTEASSPQRAAEMNRLCLEVLEGWRD